jgi:hypothetical protein
MLYPLRPSWFARRRMRHALNQARKKRTTALGAGPLQF